ncbi:hypothetical protein NDN08_002037 [Rhodosorus marinus]|uniref:ubiquitinyl hydrolase 1 n=1 Tax=Rhodosorus marinus TaxID=101924 RepID=A0AAV8USK6_9RHOD|nr:hypothetical protein NDN08_002037 [Rhodosorus marinus]
MGLPGWLGGMGEEDKELRVAKVVSCFEGGVEYEEARKILSKYGWEVDRAKDELTVIRGAQDGLLIPLSMRAPELLGAENSGNSCYLDSLLMAIFANSDKYDYLITVFNEHSKRLASLLRLFVNKIRMGLKVEKETVKEFLSELVELGWRGSSTQEDASELFIFLMELLKAPALETCEQLHHGALPDEDVDDKKVVDRMIMLGITEGDERLDLLQLIRRELHETVIEDLSREVFASSTGGDKRSVLVNAWKTVTVADSPLNMLPILLKRSGGSKRPVSIPLEIDSSQLVGSNSQMRRSWRLRSAVCHLGSSSSCGHYITFLFNEDGTCSRWDDLRGFSESRADAKELETSSYLLFYE